eukprot:TRINITY_DN16129_c0_g1_i1.p1 TRINITY_DN16129_c0_g1~~TRINITY_DN16129_c0_g1_i1.p1  ORF type:complete len:153 (-),score=7.14 TRINITY_DN16129_c0_g1_i1:72-530(-)
MTGSLLGNSFAPTMPTAARRVNGTAGQSPLLFIVAVGGRGGDGVGGHVDEEIAAALVGVGVDHRDPQSVRALRPLERHCRPAHNIVWAPIGIHQFEGDLVPRVQLERKRLIPLRVRAVVDGAGAELLPLRQHPHRELPVLADVRPIDEAPHP